MSSEDVRRALEETGHGWVVEVRGRVVAFGIADGVTSSIWALFVLPEAEGQGYGRRLLDAMVAWLWSLQPTVIWLTTATGTRAEGFYKALGWEQVGDPEGGEIRLELRPVGMNTRQPGNIGRLG